MQKRKKWQCAREQQRESTKQTIKVIEQVILVQLNIEKYLHN